MAQRTHLPPATRGARGLPVSAWACACLGCLCLPRTACACLGCLGLPRTAWVCPCSPVIGSALLGLALAAWLVRVVGASGDDKRIPNAEKGFVFRANLRYEPPMPRTACTAVCLFSSCVASAKYCVEAWEDQRLLIVYLNRVLKRLRMVTRAMATTN